MSVTRVDEFDRGIYKCIAKNNAGFAETQMNLNVIVKPKIFELKNITVPVNEEAIIICKSRAFPPAFVTFRRWGTREEFRLGSQAFDDRITLEQDVNPETGETIGTLVITNLRRSDDGLYQCVARNKGDSAFETGHIAVEYPLNFDHIKDLPPVFSWEERVANLSCMAMGIPNATIGNDF